MTSNHKKNKIFKVLHRQGMIYELKTRQILQKSKIRLRYVSRIGFPLKNNVWFWSKVPNCPLKFVKAQTSQQEIIILASISSKWG